MWITGGSDHRRWKSLRHRIVSPYGVGMNEMTAMNTTTGGASPGMEDSLARRRVEVTQLCIAATIRAKRQLLFGMTTSLELQCVPLPRGCDLDPSALYTVSISDDLRCRIDGPCGRRRNAARREADRREAAMAALGGSGDRRDGSTPHPIRAHTWKPLTHPPTMPRNVQIHYDVYALDLFHTFVQLATHVPFESLIALGDSIITAMARQPILADKRDATVIHRDFVTFVGNLPKCKGKTDAQLAMRLIAPNIFSPMESTNRLVMLAHGLPDAVANFVVPDARFRQSGRPMTLDLAWPKYRVAIEYDGDQHRTDQRQRQRDSEKRGYLANRGWTIHIATAVTMADEVARAEFALHVARELLRRGAGFTFLPIARDLRELAKKRRRQ